jgi:hypothetical protein
MLPPEDPQPPALPSSCPKLRRHNGKFCSFENRERIINGLANGEPKCAIAKALHVSPSTVDAVAEQEWVKLESRKARIAAQFERIATKSCDLLAQKLDTEGHNLTANQLVPIAGVAVDKLQVLRGEPNLVAHLEHDFTHINIFAAFQRYHDETEKMLLARQAEEAQQSPPLSLPDSPRTSQDPT